MNFLRKSTSSVSLTAVGDILLHGRVYGGLNKKSNYEFDSQLKNVEGLLGKTDITVANLETIIAGNEIGLSSFPRFNAPTEIGYTLKKMGVDLVTLANNHVFDFGEEGILKTIEKLQEIGLEYDGAYKSEADSERLRVVNKNGLRIGFLSYTRGTNGIKVPSDKQYLVNSIKYNSVLNIVKKIRKIKRENLVDVLAINLHHGEEYHLHPSNLQKEVCASLADAGADLILGHHPHVLQPPEYIETSRGTKTFVAYSLGNFFSGQNGLHRQIGASLTLNISKPSSKYSAIEVTNPRYTLTYVHREKKMKYVIHQLKDWVQSNKNIETDDGLFPSLEVYENVKQRMRSNITNLEID
ncbi:CapA family protein [Paucisalibacillus sp. EB02]|uniref:CapA family protein n=1 Tax=Paucisalibacillus sp. EB02 TaxID=1347087 RepID=UPI0004AD4B53|nr:CapA family protein [Paucisalibacillus sp. EB02]